jgi:small subunit ribosomal protein S2
MTPSETSADADMQGSAEPTTAAEITQTAALTGERIQAERMGDVERKLRDPSQPLGVRELFEAGVHFGHQTKRWNPKMKQYIYGARSGIHIVDLDQTSRLFKRAFDYVSESVSRGGSVLFVGTKRQAQEIVQEEARRAGMFYVTNRWLGGTLTNFRTMKGGLERLRSLERMREDGTYEQLPKKETVQLEKERSRLEKYIGGLKGMGTIPQAVFVIDPVQEAIAVNEARKLKIPIVAITDTNCDPDHVDFVIPGNDDAIRSIRLITGAIADACLHGMARRREHGQGRDREVTRPGAADTAVIYQAPRTRHSESSSS